MTKMWLVANLLDSTDVEHFCHHRMFCWTAGLGVSVYIVSLERYLYSKPNSNCKIKVLVLYTVPLSCWYSVR